MSLRAPSPSAHLPQEQPLTWHPELLVAPQFACACVADECHKSNSKLVLSIEEREKLLGKRSQSIDAIKQTSRNQGRIPIGALQGPVASLLSKWWKPLLVWSQKELSEKTLERPYFFSVLLTNIDLKHASLTKPPPTNGKHHFSNCCGNI